MLIQLASGTWVNPDEVVMVSITASSTFGYSGGKSGQYSVCVQTYGRETLVGHGDLGEIEKLRDRCAAQINEACAVNDEACTTDDVPNKFLRGDLVEFDKLRVGDVFELEFGVFGSKLSFDMFTALSGTAKGSVRHLDIQTVVRRAF
jgi:hypothetical protein